MATHWTSRRDRAVVGMAATGAIVSALIAGSTAAAASTEAAIPGQISAYPVSVNIHIQQLFTGSNGQLWFITPRSQLGEITPVGTATLTGAVLPVGELDGLPVPAVIAGAGPMGVWAYTNSVSSTNSDNCAVTLVRPSGGEQSITLPAVAAHSLCGGAAADPAGHLWVSLVDRCGSRTCGKRVSFVAMIATGGSVTLFPPPKPGALSGSVTVASDGSVWVLGGFRQQALGQYTATGSRTGIQTPTNTLAQVLARPDGSFWGTLTKGCFGHGFEICETATHFTPGGTASPFIIFPVAQTATTQNAVDAGGSLWEAGGERSGPSRFFRMNGAGTIDRSAAFPTAADGSALRADGPLVVTPMGPAWASASSPSGAEYLIRFVPTT
jgi:hypothetical protein